MSGSSSSSIACSSFHFRIRIRFPLPLWQRQSCGKCSVKSATSSQSAHKIVSFVLVSPWLTPTPGPVSALVQPPPPQLQIQLAFVISSKKFRARVVLVVVASPGYLWGSTRVTPYSVASIYSLAALTSTRKIFNKCGTSFQTLVEATQLGADLIT